MTPVWTFVLWVGRHSAGCQRLAMEAPPVSVARFPDCSPSLWPVGCPLGMEWVGREGLSMGLCRHLHLRCWDLSHGWPTPCKGRNWRSTFRDEWVRRVRWKGTKKYLAGGVEGCAGNPELFSGIERRPSSDVILFPLSLTPRTLTPLWASL